MIRVCIDFETRSACDLKKHGAYVYAEDPTTKPLMLAMKWSDEREPSLVLDLETWDPASVQRMLNRADIIEAHNMAFEHAIWTGVCVPRYGWPRLPIEKLRCSAAKAAMHSLPRNLEGACAALHLPYQKDMEGHRLMLKMCKPRKPRKGEPDWNPDDEFGFYWHEDPEDLERLGEYCMKDVLAEECLSDALRDLPDAELEIWRMDHAINLRGIRADIDSCRSMIEFVGEHESRLLKRIGELTNGAVKTARQVDALKDVLRVLGVDLPDLAAETVAEALKRTDLNGKAKELLEIRRSLGRSSVAKYQSIIDRASEDGRVRGSMLYHGAGTGRWAGAGIQPHNFPSRIKVDGRPETILETVRLGGYAYFQDIYDIDPMAAAAVVTRSVLTAADGKDLVVADLSAIEGRMLAWLAGEETELEAYRQNRDPYITAASMILGKPYDQITKDERQSPGKISVLACGYNGSANAVRKFKGDAPIRARLQGYDLSPKELEKEIDLEIIDSIVKPWRQVHPKTVAFWKALEEACFNALRDRGTAYSARAVGFKVQDNFLLCRLPSGRLLFYYDPKLRYGVVYFHDELGMLRDGDPRLDEVEENGRTVRYNATMQEKTEITYMTVHSMTKKWLRTNTYGGKLAENICQAASRDILANGMKLVERAGYPVVLTVHDEIISEVAEDFGSVEEFESLMCAVPEWAAGLPLKAEGFRAKRYRK